MAKLDLLEKKSIIGMIHTLALPGTMDYCGDMTKVIDRALADLHAMQNAGVDAVIVENFCDHPAGTKLEPEQMAALTAVATVVAREATIPVGIDAAFCDPMASLAIAVAVGATFIRVPVFVDTVVTSDGIVKPCARELQRYRKLLGAENIALLCDIQTKHTFMLSSAISIEESALMRRGCPHHHGRAHRLRLSARDHPPRARSHEAPAHRGQRRQCAECSRPAVSRRGSHRRLGHEAARQGGGAHRRGSGSQAHAERQGLPLIPLRLYGQLRCSEAYPSIHHVRKEV